MKIKVTQDMIDAALLISERRKKFSGGLTVSESCPIALALSLAGFPDAVVGTRLMYPFGPSNEGIRLPKRAKVLMREFDSLPVNPKKLRPLTFILKMS